MEFRTTRQRTAIVQSLERSGCALNPAEVLVSARSMVPALNLSTVYRQLGALLAEGRVSRVTLPGESARYETRCPQAPAATGSSSSDVASEQRWPQRHHHHHFLCSACDRAFAIHACPGPMTHLAPRGFRVDGHDLTLYGRCGDCLATTLPATTP